MLDHATNLGVIFIIAIAILAIFFLLVLPIISTIWGAMFVIKNRNNLLTSSQLFTLATIGFLICSIFPLGLHMFFREFLDPKAKPFFDLMNGGEFLQLATITGMLICLGMFITGLKRLFTKETNNKV